MSNALEVLSPVARDEHSLIYVTTTTHFFLSGEDSPLRRGVLEDKKLLQSPTQGHLDEKGKGVLTECDPITE